MGEHGRHGCLLARGCVLMALLVVGCAGPGEERAVAGIQEIVDGAGEVQLATGETVAVPESALEIYRARGFRPLWVDDGGLHRRGERLLEVLHVSEEEGLPADRYHLSALEEMAEGLREEADEGDGELRAASLELALTSSYFRYAGDLARGHRDPRDAGIAWLIPRPDDPGREILDRLEQGDDPAALLAELRPRTPPYARLLASLSHYRRVQDAGGWPALPEGVTLEEGDEGDLVALLRRRLIAEGDSTERTLAEAETTRPDRFDGRLREAVEHLQSRYALEADGIVGGRTLEELNTPVEQRVVELKLNLDRLRWLPRDLGSRHVLVNVAGYEMEVVDEGRSVLSMAVVVGEEAWETPVFEDTLDHVIFNPYWNVPASIADARILPELREDPGYLERNNFEVVDWSGSTPDVVSSSSIDWSEVGDAEDFPYVFRQRPGPNNALGRVKFMFPNEHNIYLHDSPEQHLFEQPRRAYSHGCIRVERPLELARLLMEMDSDTSPDEIEDLLGHDSERRVDLNRTIPIYIVYFTAWADSDGTTRFHHDPYHQDRRMEAIGEE